MHTYLVDITIDGVAHTLYGKAASVADIERLMATHYAKHTILITRIGRQ